MSPFYDGINTILIKQLSSGQDNIASTLVHKCCNLESKDVGSVCYGDNLFYNVSNALILALVWPTEQSWITSQIYLGALKDVDFGVNKIQASLPAVFEYKKSFCWILLNITVHLPSY